MEKSSKLLTLYLKKVTKMTENERKVVLFWIKSLIHPKIVVAPNKIDLDSIMGMPTVEPVLYKSNGKYYKGKIEPK